MAEDAGVQTGLWVMQARGPQWDMATRAEVSSPKLGWCCLPQGWHALVADAGVALGSFVLIKLFKGGFLLATALVSPGDSSSNNYGFVLCLCQTLTIHQLQLACFDVFGRDLDLMVYLAQK